MKRWLSLSLVIWCHLSAGLWAQPPTIVQTAPGEVYEINACAGLGEEVWLGGTVQTPTGASGQPSWTDGFLTRLGPDGRSLWQRRFGWEGGEGVRALAPLPGGGALVVGYASTDLALAWAGQPKVDWAREAFLARVGEQGQLLASLDVRSGPGDVSESYVLLQSVAVRADGQIWVGGRFEGSLWGLASHGPQAFVALLTPDFQLLRAHALDGYEVTHLRSQANRCLAAGLRKGTQEQVVLWNLEASGTVSQAWAGIASESAACRQLESDHLVFGEGEQSFELDLLDWSRQSLPGLVWATVRWQGNRLALGQSSGALAGTSSVGEGDLVLWRQDPSGWQPGWRFGTRRADVFRFLAASPRQLTLAGGSRGPFPGQPEGPWNQERASWIRLFRIPEGADPSVLGVRPADATRSQLDRAFAGLFFDQRPGFDHFSGWGASPQGLSVVSREAGPYDRWVCLDKSGQELSHWGPAVDLPAPLEPQIFPLFSGNQVVCLAPGQGAHWFRLGEQGQIQLQQTLRRPAGLRVDQIACSQQSCLWTGREFSRLRQQRRVLGWLDELGQEVWSFPLEPWSGSGADCLALAVEGQRCALLLAKGQKSEVQLFQLPVRRARRLAEAGEAQALAWVGGQLWWVSKLPDRLVLSAYQASGQRLWRKAISNSADFQISQMMATPRGATLVGARRDSSGSRGLVLQFDLQGAEQSRWSPDCDRDLCLRAARLDSDGQLWVGGEVVEDSVTDVFWGRPMRFR